MRSALAAGIFALVASVGAAPSLAQDGPTMWCYADASNGAETTRYYSALFSGGSREADAKARAFKSAVEDEEISATAVAARCVAAANYQEAVAGRNAEMSKTKGQVLDWEG